MSTDEKKELNVMETLLNDQSYHIEFNGFLTNHVKHAVIALKRLGGADQKDEYILEFWKQTYPKLPKGSELPIIYRMDSFLRPLSVRRCLASPYSSFSIRQALAESMILYIDLSNLDEDSQSLIAGILLALFQQELFRRGSIPESERQPFHLYCDEFQTAATASGAWKTMLSRGRRMKCALTLANQHPGQLSKSLRDDILGCTSSLICLNISAQDAAHTRKELLYIPRGSDTLEPYPVDQIVVQKPGEAICRFGSGAYALKVKIKKPIKEQPKERGFKIRNVSWRTFGAAKVDPGKPRITASSVGSATTQPTYTAPQPKKPTASSIGWTPLKARKASPTS